MSNKVTETGAAAHTGPGARAKYIWGYILSLVLTAIAFGLTAAHVWAPGSLITVLLILAALQVVVQLFLFMHVTEGDGAPFQSTAIYLGLFFTLAIAFGSIWIMSFNSQVQ
ncbi:MAG: cytochrome C oxidase subunit IV family protein [Thermoflavifilum sp.]|nr:cytochrome C oxidase subunit IV family protein [Thermoflavifilum sp.]MCL6514094.1 cytochrome C oxidase subunit IV family protein [Alicyclobacillus sp.]